MTLTNRSSKTGHEIRLHTFIRWALSQSQSQKYTPYEALQLLNSAWEAQQQLWVLRQGYLD